MNTTYDIDVTQDDIKEGWLGWLNQCAVAIAARRAMNVSSVYVDGLIIEVGLERFVLPVEAEQWIRRFDDDADVEPIRFTVERES